MRIQTGSDFFLSSAISTVLSRDQRHHPRVGHHSYVHIAQQRLAYKKIHHCITEDISEGGMKLVSFQKLPPSMKMDIQFCCPGEFETETIFTKGSVMWEMPTKSGIHWVSGISFDGIESFHENKIRSFSKSLIAGQKRVLD